MSARDSASGSSTYKGGSGGAGGLGNGGVGGGMSSGSRGGGAGYNGGAGSRTGMTTGAEWKGNTAFGRPGGNAVAYGMRDAASLRAAGMGPTVGSFGNFRTPSGAAMFGNSPVQGQSFYGMNMGQALSQANRAQQAWQAARPQVGGLLGSPNVAPASGPPQAPAQPKYPVGTLARSMWDNIFNPPAAPNNPLVDVQPGVAPFSTPETVPGVPAPNPPDYNPANLRAYNSPYGPEMVGQWGQGIKDRWHSSYAASHPGYSGGYMGVRK